MPLRTACNLLLVYPEVLLEDLSLAGLLNEGSKAIAYVLHNESIMQNDWPQANQVYKLSVLAISLKNRACLNVVGSCQPGVH